MTGDEKKKLKGTYVLASAYYGQQLEDKVIQLYVKDLEDLPLDDLLIAFQAYRKDGRNFKVPLPGQLRSLIEGDNSLEDSARLIAGKLYAAVGKHGRYWHWGHSVGGRSVFSGDGRDWLTWEEAVRAELGSPFGDQIIKTLGGWESFTSYAEKSDPTSVMAQIRDFSMSVIRQSKRAISIPAPDTSSLQGGGSAANLIQSISEGMKIPCETN